MQRSDFRVVLVLLILFACMGTIFWAIDSNVDLPEKERTTREVHDKKNTYFSDYKQKEPVLKQFDPNTADSTTLLNLGLPPFIVRSIYKYRSMGGVYSTPEDFARIPGLTQKQYKMLRPYITIADDFRPASLLVGERKSGERRVESGERSVESGESREATQYQQKLKPTERLSLNTADTTALKSVPGIGSYYARRIVELRDKLGGFVSLDQLLTIKNFPESALPYLYIPDGGITKININKATFQQLASHPYIGYSRTKNIMDYRRLKGKITSLKQLSLLPGFTDEDIEKMLPYVEF